MEQVVSFFGIILDFLLGLRELCRSNVVYGVGILMITGYFLAKLAEMVKLPYISGYIVAGLILGDSLLGLTPHGVERSFNIIIEIAVGILAVVIGTEINFKKLKRCGADALILTICMIVITSLIVFLALFLLRLDLMYCVILSVIAGTTSPTITLTVIKNLRVRGKFVDYIYRVLSVSDAFVFVLFGLVVAWISFSAVDGASENFNIFVPISKILISLLTGFLLGVILNFALKKIKKLNEVFVFGLGFLLFSIALGYSLHLDMILVNTFLGITLINFSQKNEKLFRVRVIYPLMPPIYSLLFAVAGISLDIKIITNIKFLITVLVYVTFRMIGKWVGIYIGASALKLEKSTKNYLGMCMIPQSGVAIALIMLLDVHFVFVAYYHELITQMINVVLVSSFITQLIGKNLTQLAVVKAVDIEV